MTTLETVLAAAGYTPRKPQIDLFEHLIQADRRGVIAQAGTGTGKSLAILAAAAHKVYETGKQSIVITPTLTLMDQYVEKDMPIAREACPDLTFAELRGRAHYWCEMSAGNAAALGIEYEKGCEGSDGGCSKSAMAGHDEFCEAECDEVHEGAYRCDYQAAKIAASAANVVVTNSDMLIVNDRILADLGVNFFELDGSLFVDEAHQLEQKLRDWASRSMWWKNLERFSFAGTSGPEAGRWLQRQNDGVVNSATRGFPLAAFRAIAEANIPSPRPRDGLTRQRETQEACIRTLAFLENPHDSAVLHVRDGSLKMDWINISQSAGELLTQRSFGLVSATVPRTMAVTLGVSSAPFIDVGHPFDYGAQAWIGFSPYGGDYRSAQQGGNFEYRVKEVIDLIKRAKGGALVLFSAFRDLEAVADRVIPQIRGDVGQILIQDRECDKAALARAFKADGNAVLFGSESFATGFDVPGDALRLVIIWKLPYPAVDPVSNAIRAASWQRYEDAMRVRAVQALGRLIRTSEDRGVVWVADSRGQRLLDPTDPLTAHLPTFARL